MCNQSALGPTAPGGVYAVRSEKDFNMTEKSQRGANLTREDRERGGRASAAKQVRDSRGQFAGTRGKNKENHGRTGEHAHEPARQSESDDQSSGHHRNHGQRL